MSLSVTSTTRLATADDLEGVGEHAVYVHPDGRGQGLGRHGRLDGDWKDCVLVERLFGDAAR